jgi:ABC-2 type transport system ATP-binding protein
MENYAIEVNNVSKWFKAYEVKRSGGFITRLMRKKYFKRALNDVSFKIKAGEIVALLGRNGSGKSTLIKILSGILYPDSGRVRAMGLEPWTQRIQLASQLGVVFGAHGQLFWNLPAIDAFEYMRGIYNIDQGDYQRRLKYFLKILDLEDVYKRQVRTLSLGEQMKCNFVASVLHNPKIIFLDEPTIGVDLTSKIALRKAILELQSKYKATFILTTHIVEDIGIAQRVILLSRGRVVFDDTRPKLEAMFGDKRHVALHLSAPSQINFKPYGRIIEKNETMVVLEVSKRVLKMKKFLSLLNRKEILDYRVAEPGLNFILNKFYAKLDRERK